MEIAFHNRTVLITGATRGIGKQLADDFQSLGANLILTGTRPDQIKKLNEDVQKLSNGQKVKYLCADFSNKESLLDFIHEVRKYDTIDVCINNAGINRINYVYDASLTDWEDILNVNLRAPFAILHDVSQIMKKHGYGRIVNVGSIFGVVSKEKRAIYSSTKAGLVGLTRAAALDLAPYGILVNCVSPGFVLTDMTRRILTEAEIKDLAARVPLGRMAVPEDISRAIVFLSSDLNTYITGQNIVVDGGYVDV
jgi:3-oxoacyl-[acyl-carrier protein] reductase